MQEFLDIDPLAAAPPLPIKWRGSGRSFNDRLFGTETPVIGMPTILVYRGRDGALMIYDSGVTRRSTPRQN